MGNILTQITDYLLTQSWQIAMLVLVIAAVSLSLKNRSSHIRYLLWVVILGKCLLPSLVTIHLAILPEGQIGEPVAVTVVTAEEVSFEAEDVAATVVLDLGTADMAVEPSIIQRLEDVSLRQWLAVGWIVGAGLLFLIALIKAFRVNVWLRGQRKPVSGELQVRIEEFFAGLSIKKFPKVWLIDGVGQPFVWGLVRGDIYLPGNFAQNDNRENSWGVLGHELSHILRFDAAVNLLQIIAQGIFWFHPFVWLANMKIRAEREKCCDEMAIARLNAKAKEYSSAIVDVLVAEYESSRAIPSLAIAGPVKNIEDRIKTIMKPGKKFYKRPGIIVVISILLLAALAVPTTLALTERQSDENDSQVEMFDNRRKKGEQTNYVRLVFDEDLDRSTFQGQFLDDVDDINDLSLVLANLPDPENTVLEWAFAPGTTPEPKSMAWLGIAYGMGDIEDLVSKYGLKSLVYAVEQPLGSKGASFSGFFRERFVIDKEIPVDFQSLDGLVKCKSIKFKKIRDRLEGSLRMDVTSYPKTGWELRLELHDVDGDESVALYQTFENSGIIETYPEVTEETVQFSLDKIADDFSGISSFELRIRALNIFYGDIEFEDGVEQETLKAQILIEARFVVVQVDSNEVKDFFESEDLEFIQGMPDPNLMTYLPTGEQVDEFLRLVQAESGSKMLAAPRVLVLDGESATMEIQRTVRYISGYSEPNEPLDEPEAKYDEFLTGVVLQVKPKLEVDTGNILVKHDYEISDITGYEKHTYKGKYSYEIPVITAVAVATTYMAENGQTLLLGGHKINTEKDGELFENELFVLIKAEQFEQ